MEEYTPCVMEGVCDGRICGVCDGRIRGVCDGRIHGVCDKGYTACVIRDALT